MDEEKKNPETAEEAEAAETECKEPQATEAETPETEEAAAPEKERKFGKHRAPGRRGGDPGNRGSRRSGKGAEIRAEKRERAEKEAGSP